LQTYFVVGIEALACACNFVKEIEQLLVEARQGLGHRLLDLFAPIQEHAIALGHFVRSTIRR
jgi:hypothetical protein